MFTLDRFPGILWITEPLTTYIVATYLCRVYLLSPKVHCLVKISSMVVILLALSDQHDITNVLKQCDIPPRGHMV